MSIKKFKKSKEKVINFKLNIKIIIVTITVVGKKFKVLVNHTKVIIIINNNSSNNRDSLEGENKNEELDIVL